MPTERPESPPKGKRGTEAADAPKKRKKKADADAEPTVRAKSAKDDKPERPKRAKKSPAGGGWRRQIGLEAATWGAGVTVGLVVVGGVLWVRAQQDVSAYLDDPHRASPSLVLSAPMAVREGMAVSPAELAAELLAGGYQRVPAVTADDQFSVTADGIEVSSTAMAVPGARIAASRVRITFGADGRISDVAPGDDAVLHPTVLATVGDPESRRSALALDEISPWVEKAVTAVEDQRFRTHWGVDPLGVARAIWHDLRSDDGVHGGSTLTQQLAKNLFLTQERSLQRKVREAFFAVALERKLTKDQVLSMYFDEVYLGQAGGTPLHGVDAAARAWFGVPASRLDIGQAATIAGVISSPNAYSPLRHPEVAKERRDIGLARMATLGLIDAATLEREKARPLVIEGVLPGAGRRRAPWAVDEAVDLAEQALGEGALATGGYRVHTTIQPLLQRIAERSVADGMSEVEGGYPKARGAEAALVAVRPTDGAVVAMVGGRDYAKSPFNRATSAWREVGSLAKPVILLSAFDEDPSLSPSTKVWDSPIVRTIDGKAWRPEDYDGKFRGEVTIREALAASLNIPAIRLAETVGYAEVQRVSRELGLSRASKLPSSALGAWPATPLEMAGAYTVFPGGGTARRPMVVRGLSDRDGATLVTFEPKEVRVASQRATSLATSVLHSVVRDGTGARAKEYGVAGPVGGKSGTTNDYRDAWFSGFTPGLVATVWVGRDTGPNVGLAGSRAALPAWAMFIADSGEIKGEFRASDDLVAVEVCADSHLPARPECPKQFSELFPKANRPSTRCDLHGGPLVKVGQVFGHLFEGEPKPPPPELTGMRDPEAKHP
jgi:penicillin-binding protein 1B